MWLWGSSRLNAALRRQADIRIRHHSGASSSRPSSQVFPSSTSMEFFLNSPAASPRGSFAGLPELRSMSGARLPSTSEDTKSIATNTWCSVPLIFLASNALSWLWGSIPVRHPAPQPKRCGASCWKISPSASLLCFWHCLSTLLSDLIASACLLILLIKCFLLNALKNSKLIFYCC